MDNHLEQLIKNKRVAIVGPSDHVNKELDEDHGEYIDSFDVVIRLNDFFYLPKELEKFYGSKYDIISSSFWHRANEDFDDSYISGKQLGRNSNSLWVIWEFSQL